jgi:nucleotide-binding universal stress UspA family protein
MHLALARIARFEAPPRRHLLLQLSPLASASLGEPEVGAAAPSRDASAPTSERGPRGARRATEPHRILCAVDFSACSIAALRAAAELARAYGATLDVLHVVEPPILPGPEAGLVLVADTQGAEEALRRVVASIDAEVRIEIAVVEGMPVSTITREASARGCDLVVVGTHGRRGASRLFLGSVAERVVRTSGVPVLTIRSNDADAAPRPIRTILCAVDFTPASERALDAAVALASRLGAAVRVVYAWDAEPLDLHPTFAAAQQREIERELGRIVEAHRAGTNVEVEGLVRRGVAHLGIVETAHETGADLVVVGTAGRRGLARAVTGSVAERVVRACEVPVLTIGAPRRGGRRG